MTTATVKPPARPAEPAPEAAQTRYQYPGIPTTCDGAEAVVHAEVHISQAAGAYPITSSTTMGGGFNAAVMNGYKNLWGTPIQFFEPESEHSAATVCEGFAVAGGRVTNFTSGQGLVLMKEVLYTIAGKRLPVTATEVMVNLKAPPLAIFDEVKSASSNYFRFRLGPVVVIAAGTRVKRPGEEMRGEAAELVAHHSIAGGDLPYERLLADAIRGDAALFTRDDSVEAAWRVVEPILNAAAPPTEYEPGTWGPPAAAEVLAGGERRPVRLGAGQDVVHVGAVAPRVDHLALLVERGLLADFVLAVQLGHVLGDEGALDVVPGALADAVPRVLRVRTLGAQVGTPGLSAQSGLVREQLAVLVGAGQAAEVGPLAGADAGDEEALAGLLRLPAGSGQ